MKSKLIELKAVTVKRGNHYILNNISFNICTGEQWAITGNSGSGKSTLASALAGSSFYLGEINYHFENTPGNGIELVEQQHHFKNLSNTSTFYYQQRFNASDAEDSITVAEMLGNYKDDSNWLEQLHLNPLLNKPLIQLSNGENKRLQLVKALQKKPLLLILDSPFTGLDKEGRQTLHSVINNIIANGIHVIVITNTDELPSAITHVLVLDNGSVAFAGKKDDYVSTRHIIDDTHTLLNIELLKQIELPVDNEFLVAIRMEDVNIRYGDKSILSNINWQVLKGECWSVSGPNGAGKSTLLSLITADNPQAYANKITLFDKKRGSGESIWDIKRKIGFVSPELHLYFDPGSTCFEVIASGLFDTIGLFRQLTNEQENKIQQWTQLLQLNELVNKRVYELSTGHQRMALLARALVKNPPMLILDEPCQGLDDHQSSYFKKLISELQQYFGITIIYVSHYRRDIPDCIRHFMQLENGVII